MAFVCMVVGLGVPAGLWPGAHPAVAGADDNEVAVALVRSVIDDGAAAVAGARQSNTRGGLSPIFVNRFAVDAIGETLLGAQWSDSSAADRQRFIAAFGEYLMDKLVTRLPEGEFSVVRVSDDADADSGSGGIVVRTVFTTQVSAHTVEWAVLDTAVGARIRDITLNGKSLIAQKQRDFAGLLDSGPQSIDNLIAFLED